MKKESARRTGPSKSKASKSKPRAAKSLKSSAVPKSKRIQKAIQSLPPLARKTPALKKKSAAKLLPKRKKATVPKPVPFHTDETQRAAPPALTELPYSYNQTKLVLMPRDPFWAYAYWDFSSETWNWIVMFKERDTSARLKLRIHQIGAKSYDIDLPQDAKQWYLDLGAPDTSFEAELGLLDSRGKFHRIALSNRVRMPRSGPSAHIDPQWNLTEFEMSELYRLSGGGKNIGSGSQNFPSLHRRSPSST